MKEKQNVNKKKHHPAEWTLFCLTGLFLGVLCLLSLSERAADRAVSFRHETRISITGGTGGDTRLAEEAETRTGNCINLNTADAAALETLPGIGPVLAARIVAWREENGPFAKPEDLMNVSGIGAKKYAALAELVSVEQDGGRGP